MFSIFLSCNTEPVEQFDIQKEFDAFYEEYMRYHPFKATWRGDFRFNDSLENSVSKEYFTQYQIFLAEQLKKFKEIESKILSNKEQLSLEVLIWQLENEMDGLKYGRYWGFYDRRRPFNHFECRPVEVALFGQGLGFPFRNKDDYINFIERMRDFDIWVDTAIKNMKEGISVGDVSPKFTIEKYLPVLKGYTSSNPEVNSFYNPLQNIPDILSSQEKEEIRDFYKSAIEKEFIPVFEKIVIFLEQEYLPHCRDTDGMIYLPNGEEEYRYLVRYSTTSDMTPEEIFVIGMEEVKRIKSEMNLVMDDLGYVGSLEEFMNQLDNDPKNFPFKSTLEILDSYQGILNTVNKHLSSLFKEFPKTPFDIRLDQSPGNRERIQYIAGSLKDSIPGIFSFAIPDPERYRAMDMENIFLHEGIPGHHFQISFVRERVNLPEFQKQVNLRAFTEGWALYAEGLGTELGLYTDTMQYLGRLMAEMMRAARLVIDVGIHLKGWTREEANDFYRNECLLGDGTFEVDRMTVWPGQALSYKVGELAIFKLKEKAITMLGNQFDIREFHYEILKNGSLPIDALNRKINTWIEEQL